MEYLIINMALVGHDVFFFNLSDVFMSMSAAIDLVCKKQLKYLKFPDIPWGFGPC